MSVARRSLQVVAFICTLLVGVTSMAVIVTQTTWFKEWPRGFIVRQAEEYVNGRQSIGPCLRGSGRAVKSPSVVVRQPAATDAR
jgi:hypothetical protein